jgi:hypothetical protein
MLKSCKLTLSAYVNAAPMSANVYEPRTAGELTWLIEMTASGPLSQFASGKSVSALKGRAAVPRTGTLAKKQVLLRISGLGIVQNALYNSMGEFSRVGNAKALIF